MAWKERTEMLLGKEGVKALESARVCVFGLGGVGSYAAEALVRAGIGSITLIDGDVYEESNLNRQLYAVENTLGTPKAVAAGKRAHSINPDCEAKGLNLFYTAENADSIDFSAYDYVADCIDTVSSKLLIIERCHRAGVPVISCMGTGNKLHPELLKICDISETSICPLARVMRRELRKRDIEHVKVLYSTETPLVPVGGGRTPGSVSFVPSCAGLMIAGQIVRDILGL